MPPRLSKRQQRELDEISALASGSPKQAPEEEPEEEEITTTSRPPKAAITAFSLVLYLDRCWKLWACLTRIASSLRQMRIPVRRTMKMTQVQLCRRHPRR